jgi:exodeoxyribonuclease VII large subunit
LRDILRILRRRFPNVRVLIYPVRVQGDGAAGEIAAALKFFTARNAADVVILARGGGSLEDLWAFNEEKVARAIAASHIPVISAVGHETDFTIADFVADVRTSTPSAAAEIVVQTREAFDSHIRQLVQTIGERMQRTILEQRNRLHEMFAQRAWRRPEEILRQYRQRTDEFSLRLGDALRVRLDRLRKRFIEARARVASFDFRTRLKGMRLRIDQRNIELTRRVERLLVVKRQRFERLVLQLEERSPLRVLDRGYAIVYDSAGQVVRAADQVAAGDEISVRLSRGGLIAEVKRRME